MKTNKLTPAAIQDLLWQTMQAVRSKKMRAAEANAIAAQSREIVRVSKAQLEWAKWTNKKPARGNKLLDAE